MQIDTHTYTSTRKFTSQQETAVNQEMPEYTLFVYARRCVSLMSVG